MPEALRHPKASPAPEGGYCVLSMLVCLKAYPDTNLSGKSFVANDGEAGLAGSA
jgi:hypothetical protein